MQYTTYVNNDVTRLDVIYYITSHYRKNNSWLISKAEVCKTAIIEWLEHGALDKTMY